MKMEISKQDMDHIRKLIADMCKLEGFRKRFFVPVIEGDTFDDLVKWVTSELQTDPIERDWLRANPSISSLLASLMVLSYLSYDEIPSDKYELDELKELFEFIESVDDEETLMDIFNRWAEYETPDDLLIGEGFRKTA